MPKKPKTERVSLNQIKKYLGNSNLARMGGAELIAALLPKWSEDPFYCSKGVPYKSGIEFFCGATRRTGRLPNSTELDVIIEKLRHDEEYIDDALRLAQNWIEGPPRITNDNPVFTSLVLISKETPTTYEKEQFSVIKETIEKLRSKNTLESLTYALFLLVMIGVLQERIVDVPHIYDFESNSNFESRLKQVFTDVQDSQRNPEQNEAGDSTGKNVPPNEQWIPRIRGYEFVSDAIHHYSETEIQGIDMAFHGGDQWLRNGDKVELLEQIAKKKIRLRVLVNTQEALEDICSHMRQPRRDYMGFDRGIAIWKRWETDFPGIIEVRISELPLLHRVYLIRKKDGTGIANVTFYTYGNYLPSNDFRLCFGENDAEYLLLAKEFDYLWEQAGENKNRVSDCE